MKKADFIQHLLDLKYEKKIKVNPIPYKHSGSTYDKDSIRVTGSKEFVDSVLSRFRDFLKYENNQTRLQVSYSQSKDRDTGQELDSYNCYLQVIKRGKETKKNNFVDYLKEEIPKRNRNLKKILILKNNQNSIKQKFLNEYSKNLKKDILKLIYLYDKWNTSDNFIEVNKTWDEITQLTKNIKNNKYLYENKLNKHFFKNAA